VRACRKSLKWGRSAPLGWGGVGWPLQTEIRSFPTCDVVSNLVAQPFGRRYRPPKFGDAGVLFHWDGDVANPNMLIHLCGHSRWNHTSIFVKIPRKKSDHRVPPLKVTQGHWNQHVSIGYLRLPISDPYIVTMGLSRTVSVENRKSYRSLPVHLSPRWRSFAWNFVTAV